MSQLFSQTLRHTPTEADIASHQLLLRAGFVRQLAAGIFSYLPLARRALTKIENILRDEMDTIGGQEITMPAVHPAELWQETGRWYQIGAEMGRFKDRTGRDMVLSMTHEEVIADLSRKEIRSYKQLPLLLYHIQTKWRDDPRPRAGLIRVREFTMKDSYSLDADWEGLDKQYRAHYQAYFNIFRRCGLDVIAVKSDVGMMGGQLAHEFMYLTPVGEDTLMLCDSCGYAANRQIARFEKIASAPEEILSLEKVSTPGCKTIEELAAFLDIPESRTAKAVFIIATMPAEGGAATMESASQQEQFVFAIVRGDMEVNETKLANAIKASELRPATEDEIRVIGAVPGYASPIGLENVLVVVDDIIPESPNLVAGANEDGYHLRNVNYGRNYQATIIADITAAQEGDRCLDCGSPLRAVRGVEVGNIFKLGTRYSEALGATYQDQRGETHPIVMGSYGIGSGRLLACIAEEHHDEQGLIWPISVAPYQVHMVVLAGKVKSDKGLMDKGEGEQREDARSSLEVTEQLYGDLVEAGIEVLYDDRNESPGVKFNDADLIGIPLRITVSQRALKQGGVEMKRRDQKERHIVKLEHVIAFINAEIEALQNAIKETVVPAAYADQ
ncbi:MAG: proline--tRNA ligase [Chloroflexota bacterium]|nr:proline--tRNA ligase [Chloroflexota bacterium]